MLLTNMKVDQFLETLASDEPAPGGGSAAALMGSVGAALTAMVAALTQGRKKYADFAPFAEQVERRAAELAVRLQNVIDQDTAAYQIVSEAFALPKDTDEQKAARSAAIQHGLRVCTESPLSCMELCADTIRLASEFLDRGFNQSSASDLGVAFLSLSAALRGAWLNVKINIGSLKDAAFAEKARAEGEAILAEALPLAEAGYEKVLSLL